MSNRDEEGANPSRRYWVALGLLLIGFATILAAVWWNQPAQMGADAEVFSSVDALFTAVTAQRVDLLDAEAKRLTDLAASGRLPAAAWRDLQAVIDAARAGQWDAAAQQLYGFMRAQKRDGVAPAKPRRKGQFAVDLPHRSKKTIATICSSIICELRFH